jgi:hypothetical protein
MDQRGGADLLLEVSYITILASTGILGSLFYLFIYLYYPIVSVVRNKLDNRYANLLLLCLLSILIAGVGNPYIFSGGMGLLYIVFLGGMVDVPDKATSTA